MKPIKVAKIPMINITFGLPIPYLELIRKLVGEGKLISQSLFLRDTIDEFLQDEFILAHEINNEVNGY